MTGPGASNPMTGPGASNPMTGPGMNNPLRSSINQTGPSEVYSMDHTMGTATNNDDDEPSPLKASG